MCVPDFAGLLAGLPLMRNEYFIRADIYTPPSIFTHGSLDLIRDRCAAFSNAPVGNQTESVLDGCQVQASGTVPRISHIWGPFKTSRREVTGP